MSIDVPARPNWPRRFGGVCLLTIVSAPYFFLVLLSLGSGWSFPSLLPDRIDGAPWRNFWNDRDGLLAAAQSSALLCLAVSVPATVAGLVTGRMLRRGTASFWLFVAYLPFVLSPVIVGICLYDLLVRIGLASTYGGVIALQFLFAYSFASIFFCEMWSPAIERAEQVVATLGGSRWAIWRHAIWPKARGLALVCWIQTALFAWLDYGVVSIVGGGNVKALTLMLFSYLREASVNQAAQSAIVLLIPPLIALAIGAVVLRRPIPGSQRERA